MSETARQVIEDALRSIWQTGEGEDIPADDMTASIRVLNNMVDAIEAGACDLSWTTITDAADTVTVVDGALRGLKWCLAFELWPRYSSEMPPQSLINRFNEGRAELHRIGSTATAYDLPTTLPIGTGNIGTDSTVNPYFEIEDD